MADTSGSLKAKFRGGPSITPSGVRASFSPRHCETKARLGTFRLPTDRAWNDQRERRQMSVLYLVSFVGGLLLAVRVMMYGVERPREENPAGERSFRLSPPLVVAILTVFGLAGYVLTRLGVGTLITRLLSSAALAGAAAFLAGYLVRKWWTVTPEHDVDD